METHNQKLKTALAVARQHFNLGELASANAAYGVVLELDTRHLEAINFRALFALNAGRPKDAIQQLREALVMAPDDTGLNQHLASALVAEGNYREALTCLEPLLAAHPDLYIARLHKGQALEALGEKSQAVSAYFGAIGTAQRQGKWLSPQNVPAGLRNSVIHAMALVNHGRREHFASIMEPLWKQHGRVALSRVESALNMYLGECKTEYADARQRPLFLYFPGLATQPVYTAGQFPWMSELETRVPEIRLEAEAVLASPEGVKPFNRYRSEQQASQYLKGHGSVPEWQAFFFFRHGGQIIENCRRCERTVKAIEQLPLVRVPEHAPEVCFSILTPGTHILPHRGVTNTRLVVHLPLIVPDGDCVLRIAGVDHPWRAGEGFVFDDTYEHEAWNRTNRLRVILLLDVWHPDLDPCEQAALTQLVPAIGAFNRAAGLHGSTDTHA